MTSFPICERIVSAAWVSTGHLSVHTHQSDPVLWLQRPGINKCCLPGSLLCSGLFFSSSLLGQSLCISLLTEEWDYICVHGHWKLCDLCVWAKWPVAPTLKWNKPSFVGDIMTYLKWLLEGLVALALFPWFGQQSGTFQKQFFFLLFFAGWGFKGGCVCVCVQRLCPQKTLKHLSKHQG